jgi:hypothetical protein
MSPRRVIAGALVVALFAPAVPVGADRRTITCESRGSRYTECRVDTDGEVYIEREFSYRRCRLWDTWGYDKRRVWVQGGCRAEFRVGRDGGIGAGGAVAIGAAATAAILAGVLIAKNKEEKANKAAAPFVAPDWSVGTFSGFDPKANIEFEIDVARDGTVTGTADGQPASGSVAKGDWLMLGTAEFKMKKASWGFSATEKTDSSLVIYFRRQ